MAEPKRPRLKDIAAEVGVSTMLVSIALRGMSGVSEETRKKIQECADRLGYKPDPALSALADYRRRTRPPTSFEQIAYVTNFPSKNDPAWDFSNEFYQGAQKRGLDYGYKVVSYWLKEHGCTQRKASSILFNRGIKGLLIAPLPEENHELALTWKYFSSVALGTSLASPDLDHVAFDHHHAMRLTLDKLKQKDYKRIGLFLRYPIDRLRYAPLDAYIGDQFREFNAPPIPPLKQIEFSPADFWQWYDAYKPEAIITDCGETMLGLLQERGLKAPDDVGVACFGQFSHSESIVASVTQDLQAMGAAAVDRLHTNLLRSAYGIPEHSYGILLQGQWAGGTTLRKG